jgi:hypothetical protein
MRLLGLLDRIWGVRVVATLIRDHVGLVDDLYYCESGEGWQSPFRGVWMLILILALDLRYLYLDLTLGLVCLGNVVMTCDDHAYINATMMYQLSCLAPERRAREMRADKGALTCSHFELVMTRLPRLRTCWTRGWCRRNLETSDAIASVSMPNSAREGTWIECCCCSEIDAMSGMTDIPTILNTRPPVGLDSGRIR